jgi:hypothetical protein
VSVDVPGEVVTEGLGDCVGLLAEVDGDVVLEAHSADVLHQVLEVLDFHYGEAAESVELVVSELALADVGGDNTGVIVGGGSAEGSLVRGYPADDGPVGVVFADCAGDDLLIVHL